MVAQGQSQLLQLVSEAATRGIVMQGGRLQGVSSSSRERPAKRQKVLGSIRNDRPPSDI